MMSSSKSSCATWCSMHGRSAGLFILRLFVGGLLVWQGGNKLFGGIDTTTGMVAGLGFPAPVFFAWVLALVEFLGGIAIILGSFLRIASILVLISMLVAFFAVHKGSFALGGMAPFLLIGSTLALLFTGAGKWNICSKMGMKGHGWLCGCCDRCCDGDCACADGKGMKEECCGGHEGHDHKK